MKMSRHHTIVCVVYVVRFKIVNAFKQFSVFAHKTQHGKKHKHLLTDCEYGKFS